MKKKKIHWNDSKLTYRQIWNLSLRSIPHRLMAWIPNTVINRV